mmetsp:Transcript_82303/g.137629  ORF Transcript_82303/g.137629 Transcript_82303/m.137629 type:complete len:132 (+) Transcript_82303:590-985(+)
MQHNNISDDLSYRSAILSTIEDSTTAVGGPDFTTRQRAAPRAREDRLARFCSVWACGWPTRYDMAQVYDKCSTAGKKDIAWIAGAVTNRNLFPNCFALADVNGNEMVCRQSGDPLPHMAAPPRSSQTFPRR